MQSLTRHISLTALLAMLMLAAVALLGSCSSASDHDPADPDGVIDSDRASYSLSLYVESIDNAAGSRAIPTDGEYEAGSGFENYIDITGGDFMVALFTGTDRFICSADATSAEVTPMPVDAPGGISKRYFLRVNIDADIAAEVNATGKVKVVMLANWRGQYPTITSGMTPADLFAASEPISYASGLPGPDLTAEQKIPMFGVCSFSSVRVIPNMVEYLGTLHLLRALAKVEVYDADETSAPVTSVSLTRYKTAAMPLPKGVTDQSQYLTGSHITDFISTPSFPASWTEYSSEVSTELPLQADGSGHYIVYLPEFPNATRPTDNTRARLKVTYADRDPYYVDFKYYSQADIDKYGTEYFHILRNNWYKFELRKRADHLDVEVQMVPYAEVTLKPGFGVSSDVNLVPVMDEDGQLIYWYNPLNGKYYGLDRVTEIVDPYLSVDPVTGNVLERDMNQQLICYRAPKTNTYYGWDQKTVIDNPFENRTAEGLLILRDKESKKVYYYYNMDNSKWYDANMKELDSLPTWPVV